ncbi:MAG: Fe-S cluster assembly protein SufD [Microthrixaceae bacterium]
MADTQTDTVAEAGPSVDVAALERLVRPLSAESANGTAARRSEALAWIAQHGMPSRHDEPWHYTPFKDLEAALDSATPAADRHVTTDVVEGLAGTHGGARLVFVNGAHAPDASLPGQGDVWCGTGSAVPDEHVALVAQASADEPTDGFEALNRAEQGEPAVVIAAPGAAPEAPVHIVHVTAPGESMEIAHPRTVVVIGKDANVSVIESYVGLPGPAVRNTVTTLFLGVGATLTHHRVQTESTDCVQVGSTKVTQAANSTLASTSVMLGARVARNAFRVNFQGTGAKADLAGLQVLDGGQRHDTMITADHAASGCRSDQEFKSVIDDRARSSFSGHIIVRPDVVATDAHQTNRNLLLSPKGQADTRPWLEIFADDVQCTHGATVGRLDDEALFYLRSRGIDAELARNMLIDAFIREVVDSVEPKSLRDHLKALVRAKHDEAPIDHDTLHDEAKRLDVS